MYAFTLKKIKNPFDLRDSEIKLIKVRKPIGEFIPEYEEDAEIYVASLHPKFALGKDCAKVGRDYIPDSGDFIIVSPYVGKSGKNILGIIAGIALSVVTAGVGSSLSGGSFFGKGVLEIGKWSIKGIIGAVATAALGGALISHLTPAPRVDFGDNEESYGWSVQSSQGPGNPTAVTFGTYKTSGQILNQHITSDGEKQYLNILYCGGEGPIDNISNIQLNGNPIANYSEVTVETRLGTNDQTVIPGFSDTFEDKSLSYKLNDSDWSIDTTDSFTADGLEIGIEWPRGLYRLTDSGSYADATVTFDIEYRKVGNTNWGKYSAQPISVTEKKSVSFRKVYRINNVPQGQYEVRCKLLNVSGTTTRYTTDTYWTSLSSIMYDDFIRPNKVLIAIKALATDQLNGGTPSITWNQTRSTVRVWNPINAVYEDKPSDNPAWAAYDIIHYCRKLKNIHTGLYEDVVYGAKKESMDYSYFQQWADFCIAKNLKFNMIINRKADIWNSVQPMETIGRGKIVLRGTKNSCIFDALSQPEGMFTMSNIIAGSFNGQFLGLKDRANCLEVSYDDKNKDYQTQTFLVYTDGWATSEGVEVRNKVVLDGCVTYEQAYREAKYRLRSNQYLREIVNFQADIDSIECQVGDVVLVQHDVPKWGLGSGRLKSIEDKTLILSSALAFEQGKSYIIKIRLSNNTLVEKTIIPIGSYQGSIMATDTVMVASDFSDTPQSEDVYSIGESNKVAKPFKIVSITRDDNFRREISALEYSEAIYAEDETIPDFDYSSFDLKPIEVRNLTCKEETYTNKDKRIVSNIKCSWAIPRGKTVDRYAVYYSEDNGKEWLSAGNDIVGTNVTIPNVKTGVTYKVKVCTIKGAIISFGTSSEVIIKGKDIAPSDVESITAAINPIDKTQVILNWTDIPDVDRDCFELKVNSQTIFPVYGLTYTYKATTSGIHNFQVKAVDNSSLRSINAAVTSLNIILRPNDVADFNVTQLETDKSKVRMTWTANKDSDLSHYEIRKGTTWDTAFVIASQLKATTFEYTLPNEGSTTFLIKAVNITGNYSLDPTVISKTYIIKPNTPTAGSILQDLNNRAELIIKWNGISDIDLLTYEVCCGTVWNDANKITTKETTLRYKINASGTWTFLIRAKNLGGYSSSILTMTTSVQVQPSNVISLTAVQSDTDKRLIKFSWPGISDSDLSYYELRQGTVWDSANVVASKISNTFYDYVASSEGTSTFLVKAVNKAGFYSNDDASTTLTISLTPERPNSGSIISDADNRLNLKVSWDKIAGLDLDYYEVKYGSTVIAKTKETIFNYVVSTGGTHNFTIRAKNVAGYYSSTLSLSKTIQAEPSNITSFTVTQSPLDRRILKFAWSAINDSDLSHYEIRKGSNWDTATVIATNIKNLVYETLASTEEMATFLIKAITYAGVSSANAKSVSIAIALNPNKPGTGSVVTDVNNKAVQILSWSGVPDTDFVTYEIKLGTNWATGTLITTTKETTYKYNVNSSGTYNFMVCAKNLAGLYSTPLNLSITANIEPLDVTDLTAIQFINDHSKVRLTWNAVSDKDVSYYELREGTTWDSASVIGTKITGLFFDTTINAERVYTYWIKAFNISGQSSLNPGMFASPFDMNPSTPQTLNVERDSNDKSILILNWSGIPDADLQEYVVKVGLDWDSGTIIAKTKELRTSYKPTQSGNYKFLLKAKNVSGFYSDEISNQFNAYIEPADVIGFTVVQNGEFVQMTWNKSSEPDVVGYEIREGSVFDNGAALVVSGLSETSFSLKVDTETTKRYHIKAINRAGYYSQSAASATITIDGLMPKNVVFEYDEIALQNGTKTNVEFGTSQYDFANFPGRFSDYPNLRFNEVGGQQVLKLGQTGDYQYCSNGEYLVERKDMGQVITANIVAEFVSSVLLTHGVTAKLQYRTSRDNTNWSEWQDFKSVQATFRYGDFRAILSTNDRTDTPEVNIFKIKIDVPDVDKAGTATVAVGGSTINYGYTYWTYPAVIPTAIGSGLRAELIAIDKSNFTVKIVNTSGTSVAGQVTWQSRGY